MINRTINKGFNYEQNDIIFTDPKYYGVKKQVNETIPSFWGWVFYGGWVF